MAPAPRLESAEAEAEPRPPGADDAAAGWSKPRVSPVPVCLPRRAESRTTGHNNNLPAPRLSAPCSSVAGAGLSFDRIQFDGSLARTLLAPSRRD